MLSTQFHLVVLYICKKGSHKLIHIMMKKTMVFVMHLMQPCSMYIYVVYMSEFILNLCFTEKKENKHIYVNYIVMYSSFNNVAISNLFLNFAFSGR